MKFPFSIFSFNWLTPWIFILLILVLIEVGVRLTNFGAHSILQPQKFSAQAIGSTDFITPSDIKGLEWTLKPNIHSHFKGAPFQTNSQGFRQSSTPKAYKKSIAILGRSISMGSGVNEFQTWPYQLNEKVQKSHYSHYQIVNFSVTGYKFTQLLPNYQAHIKKIQPKLVIIPILLPEWSAPISQTSTFKTWERFFELTYYFSHLFSYQFLKAGFRDTLAQHLATDWPLLANNLKAKPINLPMVSKLLPQLVHTIRSHQSQVILLALPPAHTKFKKISKQSKVILHSWAFQFDDVHFIDLEPDFPNGYPDQTIYYGDYHPNVEIHQQIADKLFPLLQTHL